MRRQVELGEKSIKNTCVWYACQVHMWCVYCGTCVLCLLFVYVMCVCYVEECMYVVCVTCRACGGEVWHVMCAVCGVWGGEKGWLMKMKGAVCIGNGFRF